jgi:hypothetical protein
MHMVELFLVLIAVAAVAPRYGVDSRSVTRPSRHTTPAADLAAIQRRLRAGRGSEVGVRGDP